MVGGLVKAVEHVSGDRTGWRWLVAPCLSASVRSDP